MLKSFLEDAYQAALLATKEILSIYRTNFTFENKLDDSPVTIADKKADAIIRQYLKAKYPNLSIVLHELEWNEMPII